MANVSTPSYVHSDHTERKTFNYGREISLTSWILCAWSSTINTWEYTVSQRELVISESDWVLSLLFSPKLCDSGLCILLKDTNTKFSVKRESVHVRAMHCLYVGNFKVISKWGWEVQFFSTENFYSTKCFVLIIILTVYCTWFYFFTYFAFWMASATQINHNHNTSHQPHT